MSPTLPPPAFRIAITGARALDKIVVERVKTQCEEVIGLAARRLDEMPGDRQPWLRLLSPLGEGADRLFAHAGLARAGVTGRCRIGLEVPLPFAVSHYEATFDGAGTGANIGVAEFRELLACAGDDVLTLDGSDAPDEARQRSYESLGHFLVRHCDLLIAVWDEERTPAGRGGTADTVRFALASGVPVWWIHAREDRTPRWLSDPSDLDEASHQPATGRLQAYMDLLLHPPVAHHHHHRSRLAARVRRWLRLPTTPLATYLAETSGEDPSITQVYRRAVGLLRSIGGGAMRRRHGNPSFPTIGVSQPPDIPEAAAVGPAGALSRKYQNRYRSSYMAILLLGALALVSAVLAVARPALVDIFLWVELASLILISLLWVANEVFEWHRRYLSYRVLAELGRCHAFLWAVTRGSPLPPVAKTASLADSWPAWLFAAQVRATPLPRGAMDATRIAGLKTWIRNELFHRQIRFHHVRWYECHGAEQVLGRIGVVLFVSTLAVVLMKSALHVDHALPDTQSTLAMLAALLPSLSAATFGVRSYEEFGTLAEQSEQMVATMKDLASRFDAIVPDAPLALQQVGAVTAVATGAMLDDVDGWSQLFRSKTIEA